MPVPGQAGRQPESQAVHVSETRAMISMESHSRGSAAPAYCVSYTLRLLQRQHKPTVVTRPPSVAFPPGVWPTFINHSPGGPPTSFGRHNLWELRDSASPPPRSLVWLCNLAGRLSRTRRFSSLHPLNVIKLKRNCSQDSISSAVLSLGPWNEGFADGPSDGGHSAVQQQVSQGQWQTRKVPTEVVQINSCMLVSPAWRPQLFLSPSVFIPSLHNRRLSLRWIWADEKNSNGTLNRTPVRPTGELQIAFGDTSLLCKKASPKTAHLLSIRY